jgi:hypothetical protein
LLQSLEHRYTPPRRLGLGSPEGDPAAAPARGDGPGATSPCPIALNERMPTVPADTASGGFDALAVFRYLDVIIVVLAAPFVVLLGAPVLGYVVGAVAWIVQRFAAVAIERQAARAADVKTALGLNMGSLVLRAWLIGLTILAVGLIAEREDGLAAGITVLVAFTVYFATSLILRPLERKSSTS